MSRLNTKLSVRRVLLIAGGIIALTGTSQAEAFCPSQKDLIDTYLPTTSSVGWVVVSVKLGQAECFFAGGEISTTGPRKTPDRNTIFELASVTKVFTSAIFAMRVVEGLNAWDPVEAYMPSRYSLKPKEQGVTFQQLATFTGGFHWSDPPGFKQPEIITEDEFVDDVNGLEAKHPIQGETDLPTYNHYSNSSIGFLGQVLMNMVSSTGGPYALHSAGFSNWISANLTGPLNMPNTTVEPGGEWAKGYNAALVEQIPFPWEPWGAAGALRSNAADMLTFLKVNICGQKILDPAFDPHCKGFPWNLRLALNRAQVPNTYFPPGTLADPTIYIGKTQKAVQAWAWRLLPPPTPNPNNDTLIISKNGGHPGFSTFIGFNPAKAYGVVILMNTGGLKLQTPGTNMIRHTP